MVACFRPFGGRDSGTLKVLRTACSGPSRSTAPADALGWEYPEGRGGGWAEVLSCGRSCVCLLLYVMIGLVGFALVSFGFIWYGCYDWGCFFFLSLSCYGGRTWLLEEKEGLRRGVIFYAFSCNVQKNDLSRFSVVSKRYRVVGSVGGRRRRAQALLSLSRQKQGRRSGASGFAIFHAAFFPPPTISTPW